MSATENKLKSARKPTYYILLILITFGVIILLGLSTVFVMSKVYSRNHSSEKTQYGVTFSTRQVKKFNENPDDVLRELLDDIGFRRFRLMSYWDEIESNKGTYDYSVLDSQIQAIKQRGGEVTLAIGLRQPRWPECFLPNWAIETTPGSYRKELDSFIKNTVERYRYNPTVISWQLENEFHLDAFGNCPDHDRRRLIEEYALVKSIDNSKPVIMSLANNYFGFPVGDPRPDQFGVSVYSKVYEGKFLNRYITYPFPSWYYGGRAGITELLTGKRSILHELQLEPWGPQDIWDMTITEQDKSMSTVRMRRQLRFAKQTGMKTIDLWGAEWWYWRKYTLNDPAPWYTVKQLVAYNL